MEVFVQMVNAIPGRNLPDLNVAYHLLKPWTDRFAHVNSKQPLSQESSHSPTDFVIQKL